MLNKNSRYYLIKNQAQPYSVFGKVLPEMKESFGELILRRMNDIGIKSKSELARRVGISAAYAGDLINNTGKTKSGKYQPSQEVISKLAEVLRISQTDILGTLGWITISESYKPSDSLATLVNEFSQLSIEDQWDLSYIIEIFNREINRKQTDKKLLELFQDFINNYEVLEKAGINTDKLNAFLNC